MNASKKSDSNNIAIVWDFDKTLTPQDSTSQLIEVFLKKKTSIKGFWKIVKDIAGVNDKSQINSISSSEAPVWMYILSQLAQARGIDLNKDFFKKAIASKIELYPNVLKCLQSLQDLSKEGIYKKNNIEIKHFIITAGLEDLVSSVFDYKKKENLITEFFGCKYKVLNISRDSQKMEMQNVPIYCMDKTTKTRSLFEISKGCFKNDAKYKVDDLVSYEDEWCHFENMIYIGDGDTDIPAFSLVKSRKGMTVAVSDPDQSKERQIDKAKNLKKGRRIDLFTPAKFDTDKELFKFIKARCKQIAQRYEAHRFE